MDRRYCIIGTGGFGREVKCCLADMLAVDGIDVKEAAVFLQDDKYYSEHVVHGVPVIKLSEFDANRYTVVVAIADPSTRREVVSRLPECTDFATIIHPSAVLSDTVVIEKGSVVTAGCILTCDIQIGPHAHLNLHTTIGHDCVIGAYFTTAPGANISGNCEFGDCVYFGTGSAVRQGISVCDEVTIGMGGVVVKDICESGIYVGNPVTLLKKH